jgi:fatty-acyl-CoA synthase
MKLCRKKNENSRKHLLDNGAQMLSHFRGSDTPLLNETIPEALKRVAERFPGREALVVRHQNVRLTWPQLVEQTGRVACGLLELGLQPQDRVGIWASSCVEWVLLQYACAWAGLVLVNVNPAYRSHDLSYILSKSRMRALVLRERDARADYRAILIEATAGKTLPLEHVIWLGEESWGKLAGSAGSPPGLPSDPDAVVNIQYTSGTTGAPKGVLLTHRGLLNNAAEFANQLHYSETDVCCWPFPLYHCAGCVLGVLAAMTSGTTLVLPSAQFDPLAALEAIQEERATILGGVPTMFIAELEHPEFRRFDLSSLSTALMGGAPCTVELMKRVTSEMKCGNVLIVYGQTEASPVITMSSSEDSADLRITTVGRPLPNVEVKITEQGEICTRGYLVMNGYDGEPEATARTIDAEGWLHTGDLGIMLEGGYVKITGRAKEMLIRGGENIFPREIEEFLVAHPKIADVAVVGIPDSKVGEAVLAWIRLKAGAAATEREIQDFCGGKIAHYKIPQFIRFVDAFPMTVTGKIQKFRIREIEIRERGLELGQPAHT